MSVHITCPQGHTFLTEPSCRATACPRCGIVATLGGDEELTQLDGLVRMAKAVRRPVPDDDDDDEDDDDRPRKRKARLEEDEEHDDRPRKRKPARDEVEDGPEDEPEERTLTRKQKQLTKVRLGLVFHIVKLWIYLAALLAAFIFMPVYLFAQVAGGPLKLLVDVLFQVMINLAIIFAPIAGIIGSSLCLFVPPKSEARGTIMVSLALDILAPITAVLSLLLGLGFLFTADDRIGRLANYMNIASFASTLVAWWLFMIFLRQVAFYIKETLIGSEALNIITHLILATVVGPALVVMTFTIAVFVGGIFPLIMFLVLVVWLIYFIITFPIRMFRMLFVMRQKLWDKFLKPEDDDDLLPFAGT